jgi:DNA polymerase-3 subunit alpha
MQKHLIALRPDKFEDLIAMNALYRPGPIEYIPDFIARKHGRQAISYDFPEMKEYLEDTYGITVYQEQVMLLSQKLAGFTKGDADVLRKAMGKKDKATLDKMKYKFVEGIKTKGLDEKIAEKVWVDWEAFAQYAFNKSHSTCYAFVAFQTAYLKAHYPGEYMASVMTHNLSNIDKITFFMEESKRMGIPVLGPDVNESEYQFAVNKRGQIRFGLGAVKGVGENAVISLVEERTENGPYTSVFDLVRRINLRAANKKTFESLAYSGAFDSFDTIHRATYFAAEADGATFLEKMIRYGNSHQENLNSSQHSLFGGDAGEGNEMPEPKFPVVEQWDSLVKLKFEKDVIGFYISGHPLDNYKLELTNFCNNRVSDLKDLMKFKNRDISIGAMITSVNHRTTKTGKPFMIFTIEDYSDSYEVALFGDSYQSFRTSVLAGDLIFLKGKIGERYGQADNLELKVNSIQLLSELRDKLARHLTINLNLNDVTDNFIEKINILIQENAKQDHVKNCSLIFTVEDPEDKMEVKMLSRKVKINPNNDFLAALDALAKLRYKLN